MRPLTGRYLETMEPEKDKASVDIRAAREWALNCRLILGRESWLGPTDICRQVASGLMLVGSCNLISGVTGSGEVPRRVSRDLALLFGLYAAAQIPVLFLLQRL